MIDVFTAHVSFLLFEAIFCLLSAFVYSVSDDPLRIRKSVVLSLNLACGVMLICEYLFYVYRGSKTPTDVFIMHLVNAAVYYLIILLLLFYAMLVGVRLFDRFDLKRDMPCRKRFIGVCVIVLVGIVLITISQFTGIYYYFDSDNVYHRGPLFLVAALIPTFGAILIATIVLQHKERTTLSQRLVLLSYVALPMAGEVLQSLFYGNSLMNICVGVSVLLVFFENMIHKEKEIYKASRTEARTGLANEHGYVEWLNSMKGKPELKEYAAVVFDLRKFSEINRLYGIENGNRILASFGNVMLGMVEKDEILGRQYGNKFIAIIKKKNLDSCLNVLKGVEVPFTNIATEREECVTLSAHIGVYMIDRTDLKGEDILILASHALSEAKEKDTEEVVWLTQETIDAISERKKLESDIRAGIANGEFRPFYQPKVNSKTGKLCGAEALTRWFHGDRVISPGMFIPIMEANDTICLLDFCILKMVCDDIAAWLEEGVNVPVISVNCSRRNLTDPNLAQHIDQVVQEAGIPKDLIEIEVTESSDEFSIGVLSNFVDALHELGYKVSIDDFGSVSSSLTLLREVSFDTLKIDKGFVDNVNEKDVAILTYIVKLAGEIDMDTVAEGVEKKAQIEILNDLGVDVIQGYYYDRPLPKEDMTERLKSPSYASDRSMTQKNGTERDVKDPEWRMNVDYKDFVEKFNRVACVLSVDLNEEDDDKRYMVIEANEAYKHTVVQNLEDFVTNVPYTRYIPKAQNFETLCDDCVRKNRPIHTYFDIELYNAWMEVFLTPLTSDDPNKGIVLFSYEMNPKAEIEKLTDVSSETALHVIKTCLKLRETNDFQKAIDSVVEDIRVQCGAKGCRILLTDFANRRCSVLSEAKIDDPEILPMASYLDDDFFSIVETWPRLINKSNCYIITNEKDMENAAKISPEWVASLRIADVERLVMFPLRSNDETIGYMWAANFDETKTLMIRETLNLTSFILSAEIANEMNIRKMKIMSSTDLLTGVFNRNAMNNRISDDLNGTAPIPKPFGVFFIDVNGLKTVNDTKGHLSGDNLLKDVATTLKELCGDDAEIYRIGGDEFMAIATNTSAEDFEKLNATLLANCERPNRAHFAVGACHSDESGGIIKAMQTADARMYEVKKAYYDKHPEYEWHNRPM